MRYLLLILLLSGCSTLGEFQSPDGRTWKAKVKGNGKASMKAEGLEMAVEGKSLLEFPPVSFKKEN